MTTIGRSKGMGCTYRNTPRLISLLTAVVIVGAFFPIYGISLGGIKLTMFRMGVFPLVFLQIGNLFKYNKRLISIIILFFLLRLITLLWTKDIQNGITQIFWFFEGTCLLLATNSLFNKYHDFYKVFIIEVLVIGAVSISFIFLQAILFFGIGYKLYVPFSMSIPEIATNEHFSNYPIYGLGRIVGAFYEPNMAGSMCCYYFALLLPLVAQNERQYRILGIVFLLTIIVAALFTGSRQSVMSICGSILIYSVHFAKNKIRNLISIFLVVSIVGFMASFYIDGIETMLEDSENVITRFEDSSGSGGGDVSGGRFEFMEKVWKEFGLDNFIWGVGEGATHGGGHNAFLAVFLENGILTFGFFIMTIYTFFKSSYFCYKRVPKSINISSVLLVLSWVFLMFVNWAQLNQSLSFVFLSFVFLSASKFPRQDEQIGFSF